MFPIFFPALKSPLSKKGCSNQWCVFSNSELSHFSELCSLQTQNPTFVICLQMESQLYHRFWFFSVSTPFPPSTPTVPTPESHQAAVILGNANTISVNSSLTRKPFKMEFAFLFFFLLRVMVNTITLINLGFCFTTEKLDDNHQVVGKYLCN